MDEKWKKLSEQIPVPDSLTPKHIEQKLQKEKQERRLFHAGRLVNRTAFAAICALLLLAAGNALDITDGILPEKENNAVSGNCVAVIPEEEPNMPHTTYKQLRKTISRYSTCLDGSKEILSGAQAENDMQKDTFRAGSAERVSSGEPIQNGIQKNASSASSADHAETDHYTKTDLQVQGVDEGDIVKTDGTYIYSCSSSAYGSTIHIYHANGGATKQLSKIKLNEVSVSELYLEGTRLIAVGSLWSTDVEGSSSYDHSSSKQADADLLTSTKTRIAIYDVANAKKPVLCSERTQSGAYDTSRKNGNYLYTLSTMHVLSAGEKDDKACYIPMTDDSLIPEDRLYLPKRTRSSSYLVLTALDITKGDSFSDRLSILGAGGVCYVSENHIFVGSSFYEDGSKTTISKYKYSDGKLTALTQKTFNGVLNNQFSMDEYNGYLRFVATTYHQNGPASNGLFILDKNLELTGSVEKLAKNERIYSARFLGTRAYFVTYRETDPVFLVDLSDPEKPVVKDKLKLPGFSDYLHTFGDHLLLGIGSNETKNGLSQVKLSMFDISSDSSVREAHSKLLEKDSISLAGDNHKAILVDAERNIIGLCVYSDKGDPSYRLYSYSEKGFHNVATLTPKDLSFTDARGIFIGDYFYLVDSEGLRSGVRVYDAKTFKPLKRGG